jgi:hypothetical protein
VRILPEQLVHAVAGQINEGLPGKVASVTSIGMRVRRTASTNIPPCCRTASM